MTHGHLPTESDAELPGTELSLQARLGHSGRLAKPVRPSQEKARPSRGVRSSEAMVHGDSSRPAWGRAQPERVADMEGGVSRLIADSTGGLLGAIDPYGDTVFNRLQAGALLGEWIFLEARTRTDSEKLFCSEVRQLIERVARGPHLYLKFVGD